MLEKTLKLTHLFDYYGQLLTERQQEIMKLYFFQDFSLAEIADELGISRQGVYDHLQRAEMLLSGYEKKLKLLSKNNELKLKLKQLSCEIRELKLIQIQKKQLLEKIERLKAVF